MFDLVQQEQDSDRLHWMEANLRHLRVGQKITLDYMGMPGELEMICVERIEEPLSLVLQPRLFGVLLPEVRASFRNNKWVAE